MKSESTFLGAFLTMFMFPPFIKVFLIVVVLVIGLMASLSFRALFRS